MNQSMRIVAGSALTGLLLVSSPLLQAQTAKEHEPQGSTQPQKPLIPVPPAPELPVPSLATPDDKPVHRFFQRWGQGMDRAASSMSLPRQEASQPQSPDDQEHGTSAR